jgi:predicted house-cleaning noncanonical NTP pyrophosphatase (MazG superfamily)
MEKKPDDKLNNPTSVSVRASDNAAVYYNKAFDLLKYPDSQKLDNEINEIIKDGWQHEHPEVIHLLRENNISLEAFRKGTELAHCDFESGHKGKYLFEKNIPAANAWRLCTIVLLMGRYHETQKEYEKAVDLYLASLKYAYHISQDNLSISKATAFVVENWTFKPIEDYLNHQVIEKRLCQKITAHLDGYIKKRSGVVKLIETQKEEAKSIPKMVGDVFLKKAVERYRHYPEVVAKAAAFREAFILQAYKDIDYYYGNYIRAAMAHEEKHWEFAMVESEKLNKQVAAYLEDDSKETLMGCFLADMDDSHPACAEKIRLIFTGMIPDYKNISNQYNKSSKALNELRLLTEKRCR